MFYCICCLTMPTANALGTRLITSPKNISLLNIQIFIRMCMYKYIHERTNLDLHTFSGIFPAQISIEICFALNKSQEIEIEVCFVLWLLELLLWHYLSKCVNTRVCFMCVWVNLRKLCGYLWLIECINLHSKCAQLYCNFNIIGKSMENRFSLVIRA